MYKPPHSLAQPWGLKVNEDRSLGVKLHTCSILLCRKQRIMCITAPFPYWKVTCCEMWRTNESFSSYLPHIKRQATPSFCHPQTGCWRFRNPLPCASFQGASIIHHTNRKQPSFMFPNLHAVQVLLKGCSKTEQGMHESYSPGLVWDMEEVFKIQQTVETFWSSTLLVTI